MVKELQWQGSRNFQIGLGLGPKQLGLKQPTAETSELNVLRRFSSWKSIFPGEFFVKETISTHLMCRYCILTDVDISV